MHSVSDPSRNTTGGNAAGYFSRNSVAFLAHLEGRVYGSVVPGSSISTVRLQVTGEWRTAQCQRFCEKGLLRDLAAAATQRTGSSHRVFEETAIPELDQKSCFHKTAYCVVCIMRSRSRINRSGSSWPSMMSPESVAMLTTFRPPQMYAVPVEVRRMP